MNPFLIRAVDLGVHEAKWRIPFQDLRPPLNWNTAKAELLVYDRTFLHSDRSLSQDLKIQPRGSDLIQIMSISKK